MLLSEVIETSLEEEGAIHSVRDKYGANGTV